MSFMRTQFYKAKKDKFNTLFEVKPELNPVIVCGFHQCEGCVDCLYVQRCEIKEENNWSGV